MIVMSLVLNCEVKEVSMPLKVDVVSILGPHEGRGQNTNPECQLESRVSTGITSGDESAQRATSDAS